MKFKIVIEVEHVTEDRVTDAELARGIAWAASIASATDGDSDSQEMACPSRLWLSYLVSEIPS